MARLRPRMTAHRVAPPRRWASPGLSVAAPRLDGADLSASDVSPDPSQDPRVTRRRPVGSIVTFCCGPVGWSSHLGELQQRTSHGEIDAKLFSKFAAPDSQHAIYGAAIADQLFTRTGFSQQRMRTSARLSISSVSTGRRRRPGHLAGGMSAGASIFCVGPPTTLRSSTATSSSAGLTAGVPRWPSSPRAITSRRSATTVLPKREDWKFCGSRPEDRPS
jgi:hypothetical protein